MYAYIKGSLVQSTLTSVVIETYGVGYKIFIPINDFNQLPKLNSEVVLYTSFVVRELAQTLYGFITPQARDFFEALMGVTGIGPKIAMALIGHLSLVELQKALIQSDIATLCKVPGIGKKGAERLIIEMRDKVALLQNDMPHEFCDLKGRFNSETLKNTVNDTMSALINLGYNQAIAQKAIKKALSDFPELESNKTKNSYSIDISSFISFALKYV